MNMPTNGACGLEGPLPDMMVGLRLVDCTGAVKDVTDPDEVRLHRSAMGGFGVVTHVRLRMVEARHIDFDSQTTLLDFETEKVFIDYY